MKDEDIRKECGNEIRELWSRYGIWYLIQSLADVVEADNQHLRLFPNLSDEVEIKSEMVAALRKAAASPIFEER